MMICKKSLLTQFIAIAFLSLSLLAGSSQAQAAANIILDTDMSTDVDDAGALGLLNALADNGEANILAVMHNTAVDHGVSAISAINTYYGRSGVPVGAYLGDVGSGEQGVYIDVIASKYPNSYSSRWSAPEATALYRKVLSQQPDHSVTIASIGFLTNLNSLLHSGADGNSSMSGADLVASKVAQLVVMGGNYPSEASNDWNLAHNGLISLSMDTFGNWPSSVPIVFSGLGNNIQTGSGLQVNSPSTPMQQAYNNWFYSYSTNARPSWDPIVVLYAVRGLSDSFYFGATHGCNVLNGAGGNTFTTDQDCNHSYILQATSDAQLANTINGLINQAPLQQSVAAPSAAVTSGGAPSGSTLVGQLSLQEWQSGNCVDSGDNGSNGQSIIQRSCGGGDNQKWNLYRYSSDGSYSLSNQASGRCLDVDSGSAWNGARIQSFDCTGSSNQHFWIWQNSSGYSISNISTQKCIDMNWGTMGSGSAYQQYDCTNGDNQIFNLQFSWGNL